MRVRELERLENSVFRATPELRDVRVATHEAGHVVAYLARGRCVMGATIVETPFAGGFATAFENPIFATSAEGRMICSIAGWCAEELSQPDDPWVQARKNIRTRLVSIPIRSHIEHQWGIRHDWGTFCAAALEELCAETGTQTVDLRLKKWRTRIVDRYQQMHSKTTELLQQHIPVMTAFTNALIDRKTLNKYEIDDIWRELEPPAGPPE